MKIDQRPPDPAGASQLGKAQETPGVTPGGGRSGAGRADAGADRVHLSDFSGRLLATASMDTPERAARVERLAAEVRSGRYQTDALEVSRRLIQEAEGHGS